MRRIELNHWYIGDNSLNVSLLNFNVSIVLVARNNNIEYLLNIKDKNDCTLILKFYSLDEAMMFTEMIVTNNKTLTEVIGEYEKAYINNKVLKLKK